VGLNNASIGIEVDNAGALNRVGERFVAWFGADIAADEVLLAAHEHGGPVRPWHAYTEAQIERSLELAELLVQRYGLADVVGHDDIARGRKLDPGPAFPLAAIASRALGRVDDVPQRYVVTASTLNIRKGPDVSFDAVAPPLERGTVVALLEAGDRWSKVEVLTADGGSTDVEGHVHNAFITRVKATPRGRPARGARPTTQRGR